jgi:hypothetical protein
MLLSRSFAAVSRDGKSRVERLPDLSPEEDRMRRSIHVVESDSGLSLVTSDDRLPAIQAFAHKHHAVAFGRALAFSQGLPLWVYGKDGAAERQSSETLTYPTSLE